jgi:flagellar biosynthetic protein FliQ
MDASLVVSWSREALRMALLLGGPALIAALVVGLAIGALQTLTQMHEPIVAQVPRQVVILLVVLAALPWLIGCWVAYASHLFQSIPNHLSSFH